jgi:hypothetical protein
MAKGEGALRVGADAALLGHGALLSSEQVAPSDRCPSILETLDT